MPLPGNLTTKSLHCKFINLDGSNASGTVILDSAPYTLRDPSDNSIIPVGTLRGDLSSGEYTFTNVPVCDDPDIAPVGWAYTVTEIIVGRPVRIYLIQLLSADPSTVELADIIPTVPAPAMGQFVTQEDLQAAVDSAMESSAELAEAIDVQLAANTTIVRTTGNQTVAGIKTFTDGLGSTSINGANVTSGISGTNITTGTVADARIDSAIARDSEVAAGYVALTGNQTVAGVKTFTNGFGTTTLDATKLSGDVPTASLSTNAVTITGTQSVTGTKNFTSLGTTPLNGDNVSSGTVADARIASTLARDSEVAAAYLALATGGQTVSGTTTFSGGVIANGKRQGNATVNLNNACGSGTTTSSSYANFPATSSFSFTKQYSSSDTSLKVDLHVTSYATSVTSSVSFGVNINSTDTDVAQLTYNTANNHTQTSGTKVITGLAAGTYTVQIRWKRTGGAGTVTVDGADWVSMTVQEVPA